MIKASLKEIVYKFEKMCDVPSKDDMLEASPNEPLGWDLVDSFSKIPSQSEYFSTKKITKKHIYICNR